MTNFADRRLTMVDSQIRTADVTKFPVLDGFLTVPREQFVPASRIETAYADANIPLAPGRVLLEARTQAKMLDVLDIRPDELVLDIGAGQGYLAAVISRIAEAVVALEELTDLGDSTAALAAIGADSVAQVSGPLNAGAPQHGPYDVIVIEGGIEVLPQAIADQLKDGGRIAALFMEGQLGTVRIGYKSGGTISWRHAFNASAPVLPGFAAPPVFAL